jgi:protein-export membrane protein SecD
MRRAGPILIAVIGILALIICFFPNLRLPDTSSAEGTWRLVETKLGLDLEGGLRVEYQALPKDGKTPTAESMGVIKDIIERRVNQTGVSEPVVVVQGADRVVIELPGVSDVDSVRRLVGQTGQLDFVPLGSVPTRPTAGSALPRETYPPLFSGDQIQSASIGQDENGGLAVDFVLKGGGPESGAELFAAYTADHIGEYFAITLDESVISAPQIIGAIPGGTGQITGGGLGGFPAKEANELVTVLKFGSLPFPIQELSSEQISATLGSQFLDQSLMAGFIGIALVITFMLLYYRLPGLVASFALIYYTVVVYAIFRLIPVTLTLAGIAGFVLSVGMAVDANILIFERMKEELRLGKSLPAAVEAGFNRAWNSILDSNVSSLITATILYAFGSSTIRGFALVLIIGVLVSMFSAITVTRSILRIVVQQNWARRARLYGMNENEFVARPTGRGALRGEARGRV